jgi:UDP-glucuronate 4-epimerase
MSNKILVTGAAGFIGFHLTKSLLDDGFDVIGLDNLNDYYSVDLKNARLKEIDKYKNFTFKEIDISNREKLKECFSSFKINKVVNLAAQPGVRYSIENPYAYMDSNLIGFLNIIECCRHNNIEGFIYASSSSVYGGNTKIPFSETDQTDSPVSLYAATKNANELIAKTYSHLYNLNTTGLRFFTVYGPWGRPDMAYYSFTDKIVKNKPISVFNHGKMKRDFTYIDDIIFGLRSAINMNYKCEIFNLGNNKSENLMDFIHLLEHHLNIKAKIRFKDMQLGDIKETYADISKSIDMLKYSPKSNINDGIENFISWYKNYHSI